MTTPPPPGWYDTGVPGEQAWWDGLAWTPHRRPAAAPAAPQPPVQQAAAQYAAPQPPVPQYPAPQQPAAETSTWGRGNPVASVGAGIFAAVLASVVSFLGVLLVFFGAAPILWFGTFIAFLGLVALAAIAFVNASAGFRRRRVETAALPPR